MNVFCPSAPFAPLPLPVVVLVPLPWALDDGSVAPFAAVCGLEKRDRVARVWDGAVLLVFLVDILPEVGVQVAAPGVRGAGDAPAAHSPALAPFFDGTNNPTSRACSSGLAFLAQKRKVGRFGVLTVLPSYDMKQGEKIAFLRFSRVEQVWLLGNGRGREQEV